MERKNHTSSRSEYVRVIEFQKGFVMMLILPRSDNKYLRYERLYTQALEALPYFGKYGLAAKFFFCLLSEFNALSGQKKNRAMGPKVNLFGKNFIFLL